MRRPAKIAAAGIALSIAALAIAAAAILWSSQSSDHVSNLIPPAIVGGVVEEIGSVPDSASANGDISYIEIRVIGADQYDDHLLGKGNAFMPAEGDMLTLIRSEHTASLYGPEPQVGDAIEAMVWYYRKEMQIDGESRCAYDAYTIDTYSHILEMGDEPYFPLGS